LALSRKKFLLDGGVEGSLDSLLPAGWAEDAEEIGVVDNNKVMRLRKV